MKSQNKISGRQRLTWPVVEGITATAAMIGAPAQLLKTVKASGSKAFLTGNRIDTEILIPDIIAELLKSKPAQKLDLNDERAGLARAQKEEKQRENLLAEKQIYRLEEMEERIWSGILSPIFNELTALEKKAHRLNYDPAACVEIVKTDFPRVRAKVAPEK